MSGTNIPPGLAFEQQKWKEQAEFEREGLALKERELNLREQEVAEGKQKSEFSKWTNPLVVSVFSVALAGILNFISVIMVNTGQTELVDRI